MTETAVSREMRAWFEAYLDAFNRSDFAAFGAYYAEDVAFHGQAAQLNGREAVLGFYRGVKARLTETIELLSFVGAPGRIAAISRSSRAAAAVWMVLRRFDSVTNASAQ